MYNIITNLLVLLQVQQKIISVLFLLATSKPLKYDSSQSCEKVPYRRIVIDQMPIIKEVQKFNYTQLLSEYLTNTGKVLKPIKRHSNYNNSVPENLLCPCCNAPSEYIYDNTGGRGSFQCKVCKSRFNHKSRFSKQVQFKCPHCGRSLSRMKERSCFYVWKCSSLDCSFYQSNLNSLSKKEREIFTMKPENFKLHYIFREFTTDFLPLSSSPNYEIPSSSLSRIYSSSHTLGLILTYSINYGLSARKTASILYDVHGLKISHQTIINYRNMVSYVIKPFIDNYPYEISSSIAADETYIRVNGKWNYIFFYIDTIRKTILSYYTSPHRDTNSCIIATDYVLSKFKELPNDLSFTTDGNPIYLLAQYWFSTRGINFDVNQVIGLKNQDELSKQLRPFKQAVERHNRSFKTNYRSSHGFGSRGGSVAYVTLFCAFFNFLRPHMALDYEVPVKISELETLPNMPAKWLKLIEMSQQYIREHQHLIQ